ncbi:hypothetical protein ACFY0A_05105 [Streptomyces sp. NPDC001698]|uniref:hypothetical protein n=1 Tax=Streptomyces sp. NPDC001698 TaxID=3364601 RepID=UPI0036B0F1AB
MSATPECPGGCGIAVLASRVGHADDEHIVLSDHLRGIDVLTSAIEELAHLPARPDHDPAGEAPLRIRSLR